MIGNKKYVEIDSGKTVRDGCKEADEYIKLKKDKKGVL